MILEFVYGAAQQFGRFVGGLPAAFGWSSGPAPAAATGGLVCGTLSCAPRASGTLACAAAVSGTLSTAEC